MPHKFYHGRTGRVWNVTKRAIGVEVNKQVYIILLLYKVLISVSFGVSGIWCEMKLYLWHVLANRMCLLLED